MRKALFIIALVFLCNPLLSNIDILPDAVAYLLIMIALSKPALINERAKIACKAAKNLFIVSLVKLVTMYFTIKSIDDNLSLLFSFVFFMVETSLGIPFINKLFDYFTNTLEKKEDYKLVKKADTAKIVTLVAFILRLLLGTAPDFILLTRKYEFINFGNDFSMLRYPLMALAILIFLPISIAWLVIGCKFLCKFFTKELSCQIASEFDEKIENKRLHFEIKANQRMLSYLGLSLVFAFSPTVGNVNVFYNSLIPVIFIVFFFVLVKMGYVKINKYIFVLTGITMAQLGYRIVESVFIHRYFEVFGYNLDSVTVRSEAETHYFGLTIITVISSLLFVGCISVIVFLIVNSAKESLEKHLPQIYKKDDYEFNYTEFVKKVKPLSIITVALSLVSSAFYPLTVAFKPFIDDVLLLKIGLKVLKIPVYSWFLPIYVVLTVLFVVSFIILIVTINENAYKRLYNKISLD